MLQKKQEKCCKTFATAYMSNYRDSEPLYYGVSHGIAFVLMFRPSDRVRLSQSP